MSYSRASFSLVGCGRHPPHAGRARLASAARILLILGTSSVDSLACPIWVNRVGPSKQQLRPTSDSDQTGASQRSDALCCQEATHALQQNHVIVLRQDPFTPFGLAGQHRGYPERREESPGSDAGSSPRRAPPDGLVRSH